MVQYIETSRQTQLLIQIKDAVREREREMVYYFHSFFFFFRAD